MKEYGRNGRLKPEKKKKRKFEAIMNTATQGIYSDFTPMKVAKKVTSELVGKKKQIIFYLREKGKSGKTGKTGKSYGPYIGKVRDGKVVVRTHKMSGGEMGCVFNRIMPNNFKVDKSDFSDPPKIAITKFCVTRATVIFFCTEYFSFLTDKDNKYYRYVIYRDGDNVIFKKLFFDESNKLKVVQIDIKYIADGDKNQQIKIFDKIKTEIEKKRKELKKENFAEKIYEIIIHKLNTLTQELSQPPQQSQSPINRFKKMAETTPINKLPPKVYNRLLNNALKPQEQTYRSALFPQQLKGKLQKNNKQQKIVNDLLNPYICPIGSSSIKEFNISAYGQIFFGFDINLLKTLPDPPKLYYKYSYSGEKKFYQLIENKNGKLDESQPIDMSVIPLYDLLCLYEFSKSKNNTELIEKIRLHILGRKNKTAPNTIKKPIVSLNNSNFNVNIGTNIGKSKKKTEFMLAKQKTNYFFGKLGKKFKYVSFREGKGNDEKVYYYDQADLKTRKFLMDLQDRSALEDLVSFIILRRMKNPEDKEFGKGVYEKASERIGQLKYQEIQNKINPKQSLQSPVQSLAQFPSQPPVQFPSQIPVQPKGSFLKFFQSFVSYKQPLPSNKNLQLQPQLPLPSSTLVV
jgi:hypothetical protein